METKDNFAVYQNAVNEEIRKYAINIVREKAEVEQEDYSDVIHLINNSQALAAENNLSAFSRTSMIEN